MDHLLIEDRSRALKVTLALAVLTAVVILAWPGLVRGLFSDEGFMPHGHCYFWTPGLVWLHFSTDLVIALSYLAISATLALLVVRSRGDVPFHLMFLAFGSFIVACGGTHIVEIVAIWKPVYWLSGMVKMITAVASLTTALLLPPLVPRVLKLIRDAKLAEQRREQLITAERQRDVAEAASRAKDQFLATLSHELRTPMTSIIGWSRLLQKGVTEEEERDEAIRAIIGSADAQTRLIEDLLDVSRIVSGKMLIRHDLVDLDEVIRAAISTISHTAAEKGIEIVPPQQTSSRKISGDAPRLQQVLLNLLSNAVKFSENGATVRVELEELERSIEIRVIDHGAGVDPTFLPYVFDRFTQEDGTPARIHGGLGLGLAIVKHIIELHGGSVWAESQGRGRGATFALSLPAEATTDASS